MTYRQMQELLMKEMRLYHYPIAVKFFFEKEELDRFKKEADYFLPVKTMTFCQWEIAARMKGQIILGDESVLCCGNAKYSMGWKDLDAGEIKGHLKYTRDAIQAEKFVRTKSRLSRKLLAISVAPVGSIDGLYDPDTVHFYCDNMQAYHLAVDYMAATDTHPLHPTITMNSSACGGNVTTFVKQEFNMLPACSGSYNAGKTERGEINVIIPGSQFASVVERLAYRVEETSSSITKPGDGFPGQDVCKNCPVILFKKDKKGAL